MTARISFVAHPDDDLLFLNPDLCSDVQGGVESWTVYLTAGNLIAGSGGMPYADQRINGLRAAYARAAKVANAWEFQLITLPGGRTLASNYLRDAPHVHLVWMFINAANGTDNGDLCRMWGDPNFVAAPIDGRPTYTRATFIATLKAFIVQVQPLFVRALDAAGQETGDHIDHAYAGKFALAANLDATGKVARRLDVYFGYAGRNFPVNVSGTWASEKLAIWQAYKPYDSAFAQGSTSWDEMAVRQFRRHVYAAGDTPFGL